VVEAVHARLVRDGAGRRSVGGRIGHVSTLRAQTRVPVMVWEKPGATSPPVLVRALSAIGFRRSGRDGARTGRAGALRSWRSGTARAGTRSAGDRTAAPRQRGASLRSRSGTGAPRPVPTGRPAGPAPAAGRTPRPAAHRTPE